MDTILSAEAFVEALKGLEDPAAQRTFIEREIASVSDQTVQVLKTHANNSRSVNFPVAIQMCELLFYIAELTGQPLHRALALMVQANNKVVQNELHEAVKLYDEARQWACAAGNEVEAARSQVGKISGLVQLSRLPEAIQTAQEIKGVLLQHGEIISAAITLKNQADAYTALSNYKQALEVYDEALQLLEELDTPYAYSQRAVIIYNSAYPLIQQNRLPEALERTQAALQICQQQNNRTQAATVQQRIAECYYLQGHFNKALRLLLEVAPTLVQTGQKHFDIGCKDRISLCYFALGQFEKVVDLNRELLAYFDNKGLSSSEGAFYTTFNLGQALHYLGQLEEAQIMLEQTLQVAQNLANPRLIVFCQFHLAQVKLSQGELNEARQLALNALEVAHQTDFHFLYIKVQLLLGRIALSQNDWKEATSLANEVVADLRSDPYPLHLYQARLLLGQASRGTATEALVGRREHNAQALHFYQQCLQILEQMRNQVAAESRNSFLQDKSEVYEALTELYLEQQATEQAFEIVEKAKSRALAEMIGGDLDIRVRVRNEVDRPLVEEYEKLRIQHNEYSQRLAAWRSPLSLANAQEAATVVQLNDSERQVLQRQRLACERQMDVVTERLQVRNADYTEDAMLNLNLETRFEPASLPPQTALIEYYIAHDQLIAFVATRDNLVSVPNLTGLSSLNRTLSLLRFNLASVAQVVTNSTVPPRANTLAQANNLLQQLYKSLIAPLEPYLTGYNKLIIVPHGPLHYLPFHALFDGGQQSYLLEKFEAISYLPCASLWQFCQQRAHRLQTNSRPFSALLMSYSNGGALPYALQEGQLLQQLLGQHQHHHYQEQEATIARFQMEANHHRLIHLATHAQFRPDAPLFSSLLLADGELTAHDIYNQELQASLVTLSACETGLGALGGGDELLGLSRACLYAGASSIALSLWQVHDEAGAYLMQEFYYRLLAGESKAVALRQAQLKLLHEPRFQHPFHWSPFVLVGDPGIL